MPPARTRPEIDALADLLGDFAADGWHPGRAEEAFDLIADRYRVLASAYVTVADDIACELDGRATSLSMSDAARVVLRSAHRFLFADILTNAGRVRQRGDPGGSAVHFGGQKGHRREWRFAGVPAPEIDAHLARAFAFLSDHRAGGQAEREQARDNAVRFYAELSRIHPFYDANGRTGRFVVSVYLHLHGWLVEWGRLNDKEREFIRRINNVNEKKTARTDYDAMLLRFWRRYVIETDAFELEDDHDAPPAPV